MADADTIHVEADPGDDRIRHVRLDRPDAGNTITLDLLLELTDALDDADRDDATDAIVLGSTGDTFCAGGDLGELGSLPAEDGIRWMTAYFEAIDRLRDTGKPAIAAVEGPCVAGGNELAMGCDLVVAGEGARFGQPEVGVGSTAAGGGVQLLPLMIGEKRARELLLTGDLIGAEEARHIGLINRVVEAGGAEAEATSLAGEIIDGTSPQAYRTIKAIMKGWTNLGLLNREMARDMTAQVWASEEFRERADAFMDHDGPATREFTGVRPPVRGE